MRSFLVVMALMSVMLESAGASPLVLVRDGKPNAAIVIASGRDWTTESRTVIVERHSAACLRANFTQMSGAMLPVIDEKQIGSTPLEKSDIAETFIVLGESALARSLGVTSDGLKPGGFRMRTVGNALIIVGHPEISHPTSDAGGLRRGVVTLLESLGCRYLWPGESGKVVPQRSTIAIESLDVMQNPVIPQRKIRDAALPTTERLLSGLRQLDLDLEVCKAAWVKASETEAHRLVDAPQYLRSADFSWLQWHGLGGDNGLLGGHAFSTAWERWGADHPEWFALQADGNRDQSAAAGRSRLCVSNPGLIQAVADDVLAQAEKNPARKSFSLCPNDGGYSSFCMCEQCEALDPADAPKIDLPVFEKVGQSSRHIIKHAALTDRFVYFWNSVAERVVAKKPDLLLLVEAYSFFSTPPLHRKLHPNLVVRYVPTDIADWDAWRQAGAQRIYWRPNILWSGAKTGELNVRVDRLASSFNHLAKDGMLGVDMDSILDQWSTLGLNYYAAARLCWDPTLSQDQIIDDYCRAGFGAGASSIKQYFELAQQISIDLERDYTPQDIAQLRGFLHAAESAAADDQRVIERIAFLRLGLNHTALYSALCDLAKQVEQKQEIDRDRAWRLMDVNYLALRDIAVNRPLAINCGLTMRYTGNFHKFRPLGWKGQPTPDLLKRVNEAEHQLTGHENSFDEMGRALGLDIAAAVVAPANVEADEQGRVVELGAQR